MSQKIRVQPGGSSILTPAGTINVIPGRELLIETQLGAPWSMPVTLSEIERGEHLCYELRSDGQSVFIGGPDVTVAMVVDLDKRAVVMIPLLRSREREDWDPGGSTSMDLISLSDGRLVVVYESGILLLDKRWDLGWHNQLRWVHLGFFPEPVDSDTVWLNSDWGRIGYALGNGMILDPDGNYEWRAREQERRRREVKDSRDLSADTDRDG